MCNFSKGFFTVLVMEQRLPSDTKVFTLRSVNVLRKYSSLLDVPMSFLLASIVYTASVKDWCLLHKAMAAHHSQNVWFRKLYMLFSRYILINTFDQLKMPASSVVQGIGSSTHQNQISFRRQTSFDKRKTHWRAYINYAYPMNVYKNINLLEYFGN